MFFLFICMACEKPEPLYLIIILYHFYVLDFSWWHHFMKYCICCILVLTLSEKYNILKKKISAACVEMHFDLNGGRRVGERLFCCKNIQKLAFCLHIHTPFNHQDSRIQLLHLLFVLLRLVCAVHRMPFHADFENTIKLWRNSGCAFAQSWRFNWDFKSGSIQQWQILLKRQIYQIQVWYLPMLRLRKIEKTIKSSTENNMGS